MPELKMHFNSILEFTPKDKSYVIVIITDYWKRNNQYNHYQAVMYFKDKKQGFYPVSTKLPYLRDNFEVTHWAYLQFFATTKESGWADVYNKIKGE